MAKVEVFERFIDALDRRSAQLTATGYDYKAGFMQSILEFLAKDSSEARTRLITATKLLEEWSDEQEARDRRWEIG